MSDIRFILTKYKEGILSFALNNEKNCFETVSYTKNSNDTVVINIGDIFVAKVLNVVPNLNAAFIYYAPKKKGYLSLDNNYTPILLNRKYDGRILAGDEIIVQLEKEAVRTKEPVFTMNLSLVGKYCVVTNGNLYKGVSKKCSKLQREQLLKAIPQDINYGVVIRTNAAELIPNEDCEDNTLSPVTNECIYLNSIMDKILTEGIHRTCYSRIWQSPPAYLSNLLGDTQIGNYSKIITDDEVLYNELIDFASAYMPQILSVIVLYKDDSYPLQKLYGVDTKMQELLSKKVWLKSGAYIVIEKTEAMYVIDVNSGKNITRKNYEQYISSINAEAAVEIMRQIRLRNLTGIIIIDFINMENKDEEARLLKELKSLAKQDRILTTVVDITPLGLVEITRKKTTKALNEQLL